MSSSHRFAQRLLWIVEVVGCIIVFVLTVGDGVMVVATHGRYHPSGVSLTCLGWVIYARLCRIPLRCPRCEGTSSQDDVPKTAA